MLFYFLSKKSVLRVTYSDVIISHVIQGSSSGFGSWRRPHTNENETLKIVNLGNGGQAVVQL